MTTTTLRTFEMGRATREAYADALVALDKLAKIGRQGVANEFASRGVATEAGQKLLVFVEGKGDEQFVRSFLGSHDTGIAALENVRAILELCGGTSAAGRMRLDPSLARGLSYYTGAIMEINVPDLPGSLGGGGRYDNLVGMFLGQTVPACGFSLGLERILVVMGERGMFPPALTRTPADVMTAVLDVEGLPHALRLAARLRECGLRVLVYPDADKIGRQLKYADSRGIRFVEMASDNGGRASVVDLVEGAARSGVSLVAAAGGEMVGVPLDTGSVAVDLLAGGGFRCLITGNTAVVGGNGFAGEFDDVRAVTLGVVGCCRHGLVCRGRSAERERGDRVDDLLGRGRLDPLPRHARAQLRLHLAHARLAALEAEGAAQLLGLGPGESRRHHGHAQQLLLEQRHPERAGQDGLQARVRVAHRLAPAPAADVGMHHVAHDGAGPDDGHLHHEVVEALGPDARQRRHLGPALHLEDADGVGLAQHAVDRLVVRRQVGEIHLPAALLDHAQRVLQQRHHAEGRHRLFPWTRTMRNTSHALDYCAA